MSKIINGIEYTHQTWDAMPLPARKLGEQHIRGTSLEVWATLRPSGIEDIRTYPSSTPFDQLAEKKSRPRTLDDVKKLCASVPSPCLWAQCPTKRWMPLALEIGEGNIELLNADKVNLSLNPFKENLVILGWEIEE